MRVFGVIFVVGILVWLIVSGLATEIQLWRESKKLESKWSEA